MAKRQKLDYSVRQTILKLHKEKYTIRESSDKVKRSKSVVGRVVKSYNDTSKIVSAFKTGRPRKTSAREDRIMQRMSLKDRFKSCTEIKRVMNSTSCVNVSRQTVSRRLHEIGLFNRGEGKGATPFPGLLHFTLDPNLLMVSAKQRGIKYNFLVFVMTQLGIEPRSPSQNNDDVLFLSYSLLQIQK